MTASGDKFPQYIPAAYHTRRSTSTCNVYIRLDPQDYSILLQVGHVVFHEYNSRQILPTNLIRSFAFEQDSLISWVQF